MINNLIKAKVFTKSQKSSLQFGSWRLLLFSLQKIIFALLKIKKNQLLETRLGHKNGTLQETQGVFFIMSRQLKPNEWIYYFNLHEKNFHRFQSEYELLKQKPFKNNVKAVFIRKYRIYKYNNSVDVLISKTGKAPKKERV